MPKHIANYVGFTTILGQDDAGQGNKGFWNFFDQFYFRSRNEWATIPISATGGSSNIAPNGYKYHYFSSPGTFNVTAGAGVVDVLIVAGGGGGGGGYYSGGAGGGGVLYGTDIDVGPGPYPVVVGSGGAGSPGPSGSSTVGGNSSFDSVTALGGGKGGSGPGTNDGGATLAGGSGGGSSYYNYPGAGPASPQPAPVAYVAYGQDGGASREGFGSVTGGSGGGAGHPGAVSPSQKGGNGQPFPTFAKPFITAFPAPTPSMGPTADYYGGGGSGGTPGITMPGGLGGGGTGTPGATGGAGTDSLGGGGGGGGNPLGPGGAGGSGSVIIRYVA